MPRHLDGAVVVVLGAGGGLGRAITTALGSRGATVVGASRSSDDVSLDIRDVGAGDELVNVVRERHGRLDGVVNATGIVAFGNLADTDDAVIEELFLTNVLGPLWLTRRVAPMLAEHDGFVVNISGVIAESPVPGMAAYAASKAALAAAATALRRELRRSGITVIDVRPPHTETGLADHPLAGSAPRMPSGLDPAAVGERIVAAIEADETDVGSDAFGG
ncbi:MAG: SDR family NAD(P)-dependent oxidoreductase [Ilumatobacteraceae bacterium]